MTEDTVRTVDATIAGRRSVRAFLPTPVPREVVTAILDIAARAPSGVNTQPWKVHVLTGGALKALSDAIVAAYNDPQAAAEHVADFNSYPDEWASPYIERRRRVGSFTGCSASRRATRPGCTRRCGATTSSSARPWG